MRPKKNLRPMPAAKRAGGGLNIRTAPARGGVAALLAVGAGAAAAAPFAATVATAQTQPAIKVADPSIRFGQAVVVRGNAGADNAGRQASLEYGSQRRGWRVVRSAAIGRDGAFAFALRPRATGHLRVAVGDGAAPRSNAAPATTALSHSATKRVTVAARIRVPHRRLDVGVGETAVVRGFVGPYRKGRLVRLEVLRDRRWRIAEDTRTDRRGRFTLRHKAAAAGSRYARVTFRGDAANGRAVRRVGKLHAYRAALASRYDMYGGPLACGGRLGYHALVVAHKTLPCGTKVRIRYRGRTVNATVRDRGPYVGGREYDLAGAVARRLGFNGVGRIWVSR